jgi:hypothetical protein
MPAADGARPCMCSADRQTARVCCNDIPTDIQLQVLAGIQMLLGKMDLLYTLLIREIAQDISPTL